MKFKHFFGVNEGDLLLKKHGTLCDYLLENKVLLFFLNSRSSSSSIKYILIYFWHNV